MRDKYRTMLERGYEAITGMLPCPPDSRLEYLGDHIFDFTTYDGEMSALFAKKAVDVCEAINNGTTFDYIKDEDCYTWYLLMCNMPFFCGRIDWGSSIRGAWWSDSVRLQSSGLWVEHEQCSDIVFSREEWEEFIRALVEFAKGEKND